MKEWSVGIIGTGNLSWHLSRWMHSKGIRVKQIFGRNVSKRDALAGYLNAEPIGSFRQFNAKLDLYILAVSDQSIYPVAAALSGNLPENALVVHTSGGTPSTILQPLFKRSGVFYPLQTFTEGQSIHYTSIPVCIEAAHPDDFVLLQAIATELTQRVVPMNDRQRQQLHLAAVLANNFVNHLYSISDDLLKQVQLDFDLLGPLIEETTRKVLMNAPAKVQTGPARRGDVKTINEHLRLLKDEPELADLYQLLSGHIQHSYAQSKY